MKVQSNNQRKNLLPFPIYTIPPHPLSPTQPRIGLHSINSRSNHNSHTSNVTFHIGSRTSEYRGASGSRARRRSRRRRNGTTRGRDERCRSGVIAATIATPVTNGITGLAYAGGCWGCDGLGVFDVGGSGAANWRHGDRVSGFRTLLNDDV